MIQWLFPAYLLCRSTLQVSVALVRLANVCSVQLPVLTLALIDVLWENEAGWVEEGVVSPFSLPTETP